jgi:hypothetical protein
VDFTFHNNQGFIMTAIMKDILGDKFATKQDLLVLEANLERKLTLRMGAMVATGTTLTVALISLVLKISGVI